MEQKNNNLVVKMSVFGAIFFIFGFVTTYIIALSSPAKKSFDYQNQLLLFYRWHLLMPAQLGVPNGKLIDKIENKITVHEFC